jgi:hypothetical protein
MADLGDTIGALMVGLIRARRMADEQTAALAEYYKTNPLLEGLSVPRIRVPELTIDMPFIIDDHVAGEIGEMEDPAKIAGEVGDHLKSLFSEKNVKVEANLHSSFITELKKQLALVKRSKAPISREIISRSIQSAFVSAVSKTKTVLTPSEHETIETSLRNKVSTMSVAKESTTPSIVANVKTAEVKEQASPTNVVRLKITLKEEGLEWATQVSETGGVIRNLQPE